MERYKLKQIVYILGDYHGSTAIFKARVIGINVDNDDNYTYTLDCPNRVGLYDEKRVFASVQELIDNLTSVIIAWKEIRMRPDIRKAFKGFKIDKKETIECSVVRYELSDGHEHYITLKFIIPVHQFMDKKDFKVFVEGINFLDSLGYWRDVRS